MAPYSLFASPMTGLSNNSTVVLLHITDTHLHATSDSRMRGVKTYETFQSVLAHVQRDGRWPPHAMVVTGDIVQDESKAGYKRFRSSLETLGVPVFCTPGNHDDPDLMEQLLQDPPFQVCGETRFGGWTLILLNTFSAGDDGGRLDRQALAALEAALSQHRDQHVLIFMHHHPLPMGSTWLDGVGLRDAEQFLEIVERHDQIRGVLWGHVHQVSDRKRGNVRFMSTPSTCSQFLPSSEFFVLDEKPPGLRWLVLHADGSIETEVGWLDKARLP